MEWRRFDTLKLYGHRRLSLPHGLPTGAIGAISVATLHWGADFMYSAGLRRQCYQYYYSLDTYGVAARGSICRTGAQFQASVFRSLATNASAVLDCQMDEHLIWPSTTAEDGRQLQEWSKVWTLQAACVFERLPVLAAKPPQWELEYDAYQDKIARMLHQRGIDTDPFIKQVSELADLDDAGEASAETKNMIAKKVDETAAFVTARKLPADICGDRRTVGRALTKRLYLLVKARDVLQKDRVVWQLPTFPCRDVAQSTDSHGKQRASISMRETVLTGLSAYIGGKHDIYPVGNAPIGHLCFELPAVQRVKHDTFGKKVFFYRVQYLGGEFELNRKRVADFAWVTKEELDDYFPGNTARRIKAMLH
eukprot:SAG31_NODE_130_length_23424_cov_45.648802_7_plen_365_part_00